MMDEKCKMQHVFNHRQDETKWRLHEGLVR